MMHENVKPLQFYIYPQFVDQKLSYTPLLFPFWSPKFKCTTPFSNALWKKYQFDMSYYCLVNDLKDADYILLPHRYWLLKKFRPDLLIEFLKEAEGSGKPVLIDAYGDLDVEIPVKNSYILRTSQYRFKMKPNDIMVPAYVEDLYESFQYQGAIAPRRKTAAPVIGFAGWADAPTKTYARMLLKAWRARLLSYAKPAYAAYIPGLVLRKHAITFLQQSKKITTNFVIRQSYSGNTKTIDGEVEQVRSQFISNIVHSDYILNIKGNGNYSQRFYETLSLGRIPLFIDTECVLPLESILNYREFCLFVDYTDLKNIAERVYAFHRNLGDEHFCWMQQRARQVFENYLRVDRFTKYLMEVLRQLSVSSKQ